MDTNSKKIVRFFTFFTIFVFTVIFFSIGLAGDEIQTTADVNTELTPEVKDDLADAGITSYSYSNCQWIDNCFFCSLDAGHIRERNLQITCNYEQDRYNYGHNQLCVEQIRLEHFRKMECTDDSEYCVSLRSQPSATLDSCVIATTDYSLEDLTEKKISDVLSSYQSQDKTVTKRPDISKAEEIK